MESVIDIASLRKHQNIKQSDMAELLGINQSQISEIERGIRPVSTKYEEILVAHFGKDKCDEYRVETGNDRRLPKSDITIIDKSNRSGGDNANEIRKAGRDYYEEPCREDKVMIDTLRKEVEHLTTLLAEREKRVQRLESDIDKKDAQIERLISLLEKK